MDLEIPREALEKIEEMITQPDSPVGIDAKKTHVLILYKLMKLEERLDRIESRLVTD